MIDGRLNSYLLWRQQILITYPTIIALPHSAPMSDIADWIDETKIDCHWHLSRFNIFDFHMGYDFFFRQIRDASFFRLAWGGTVETRDPPDQLDLFYND